MGIAKDTQLSLMHIPVCKKGKLREEAVRRGALYPFELALQDQRGSARELPKVSGSQRTETYHIKASTVLNPPPLLLVSCLVLLYRLAVDSRFDAHLFWDDMVILLKMIKHSLQQVLRHFFSHLPPPPSQKILRLIEESTLCQGEPSVEA